MSKTLPLISGQNDLVALTGDGQRREQNGSCCGKDGICSHEVLGSEKSSLELKPREFNRMLSRKVDTSMGLAKLLCMLKIAGLCAEE